jgi:hypothetical protein
LDFAAFQANLEASDPNEYVPGLDMHRSSAHSSVSAHGSLPPLIVEDSLVPDDSNLNFDIDWDNLDNDYTAMSAQLLTPAPSVEAHVFNSFSRNPSISVPSPLIHQEQKPSLSPGGQGNIMLYSPHSNHVDEGFQDIYDHPEKPMGDFTLFESAPSSNTGSMMAFSRPGNFSGGMGFGNQMFQPLSNYDNGAQYIPSEWSGAGQDLTMNMDDDYMRMDDYHE